MLFAIGLYLGGSPHKGYEDPLKDKTVKADVLLFHFKTSELCLYKNN